MFRSVKLVYETKNKGISFEEVQKNYLPLIFLNNKQIKEKEIIELKKIGIEDRMIKELHRENEYRSYMIKLKKWDTLGHVWNDSDKLKNNLSYLGIKKQNSIDVRARIQYKDKKDLGKIWYYNSWIKERNKNIIERHKQDIESRKMSSRLSLPYYFFTHKYIEGSKFTQLKQWTSSVYNFLKREKSGIYHTDSYVRNVIKMFFAVKFFRWRRMWHLSLWNSYKMKLNKNVIKDWKSVMKYTSLGSLLKKKIPFSSSILLTYNWAKRQIFESKYIRYMYELRSGSIGSKDHIPRRKSYLRKLNRVIIGKPLFRHTSYSLIIDLFIVNKKTNKIRILRNIITRRGLYKYIYSMYSNYKKKILETINRPRFFYINLIDSKVFVHYRNVIELYQNILYYKKRDFFLNLCLIIFKYNIINNLKNNIPLILVEKFKKKSFESNSVLKSNDVLIKSVKYSNDLEENNKDIFYLDNQKNYMVSEFLNKEEEIVLNNLDKKREIYLKKNRITDLEENWINDYGLKNNILGNKISVIFNKAKIFKDKIEKDQNKKRRRKRIEAFDTYRYHYKKRGELTLNDYLKFRKYVNNSWMAWNENKNRIVNKRGKNLKWIAPMVGKILYLKKINFFINNYTRYRNLRGLLTKFYYLNTDGRIVNAGLSNITGYGLAQIYKMKKKFFFNKLMDNKMNGINFNNYNIIKKIENENNKKRSINKIKELNNKEIRILRKFKDNDTDINFGYINIINYSSPAKFNKFNNSAGDDSTREEIKSYENKRSWDNLNYSILNFLNGVFKTNNETPFYSQLKSWNSLYKKSKSLFIYSDIWYFLYLNYYVKKEFHMIFRDVLSSDNLEERRIEDLKNKLPINEGMFVPYYRYLIRYYILIGYMSFINYLSNSSFSFIRNSFYILKKNFSIFNAFLKIHRTVYNFVLVRTLLGLLQYNYRSLVRINPKYAYLNKLRYYYSKLRRINMNSWLASMRYMERLRKTPRSFWKRYHRILIYYYKRIAQNALIDTKRKVFVPFVLHIEDILFSIYGKWVILRLWPLKTYILSSYMLSGRILLMMLWRKKGKRQDSLHKFLSYSLQLMAIRKFLNFRKIYMSIQGSESYLETDKLKQWPVSLTSRLNQMNESGFNYKYLEFYEEKRERNHILKSYSLPENSFTTYLWRESSIYNKIVRHTFEGSKVKIPGLFKKAKSLNYYWLRPFKSYLENITTGLDISGIQIRLSGRSGIRRTNMRAYYRNFTFGNLGGPIHIIRKNIVREPEIVTLPYPYLRGHFKSNIDYSWKSLKSKNGVLTLKIWISSIMSNDVQEILLHLLRFKFLYNIIMNKYYTVTQGYINKPKNNRIKLIRNLKVKQVGNSIISQTKNL